jgi:hypothetical protein
MAFVYGVHARAISSRTAEVYQHTRTCPCRLFDAGRWRLLHLLPSGGEITPPPANPNMQAIPVSGDYDGDLRTDRAIYDHVNALFAIIESDSNQTDRSKFVPFGVPNGQGEPIPATLPGALPGVVQALVFSLTPDAASNSAPDFNRRDRH